MENGNGNPKPKPMVGQVAKRVEKRMKHVPQRTCVGCQLILPKKTLMRLVRTPQGVQLDPSGKANGRGAYLHNSRSCWEKGLKGALARALKTELTDQDQAKLREVLQNLPDDSPEEKSEGQA
jgi:uncharacterized protein